MSVNISNSNLLSQTPTESSPAGNPEPTDASAPQGFSKILSQKAHGGDVGPDAQPPASEIGEFPSVEIAGELFYGLDWTTADALERLSGIAAELVASSGESVDTAQVGIGVVSGSRQDDSAAAIEILPFAVGPGNINHSAAQTAAGMVRGYGNNLPSPSLVAGTGPNTSLEIGAVPSSHQGHLQVGPETPGALSAGSGTHTSSALLQSTGQALMSVSRGVMTQTDGVDFQALNVRPTADHTAVANTIGGDAGKPIIAPGPDAARQSSWLLEQPVNSQNWEDGFGDRILWLANNRQSVAELRLNPPQLGTVDVRIAVQGDQAQVAFQVPAGTARDAVEAALPRLREMFAEAGMNLLDVGVSDHPSHQDSNAEAENDADPQGPDAAAADSVADTASAKVATTRSTGQLDLFV